MRIIAFITGVVLIATILWDVFETVILPRRVTRRIKLTTFFYSSVWFPWSWVAQKITDDRRREKFLGLFGPLSLLVLLVLWAVVLIFGYTLLLWSTHAPITAHFNPDFGSYLYLSGVTFLH